MTRTKAKRFRPHALAVLAIALPFLTGAAVLAETAPVTVLAAGDIAFCNRNAARQLTDWFFGNRAEPGAPATAALLDERPGTVLVMGDLAYWEGTAEEFRDCYDASWGTPAAPSVPV